MTDFNVDTDENPLAALAAPDETSPETEAVQPEAPSADGQGSPDVSSTDEPSAVQPEGQGLPDAETGLFNEYLTSVPEEHRSTVEQYLKDAERNVNGKLQEAAEAAKSWEPFSELNLQDVGAEGVGALLEFAQDLSNPETAADAIRAIAEAAGVDLNSSFEPGDGPDSEESDVPLTRAEFQAWQQEQVAQAEQARQFAEARDTERARLDKEYAEVEALHGKKFGTAKGPNGEPTERERLIALAVRFQPDHDEPIKAAYQWMQSIRGDAEAALVNSQPTPPGPSERGGRASSPVQPVDNFDDALRIHTERNASVHS